MTTALPRRRVVVVGSVNRDYSCRVGRFPSPGETVIGSEVLVASGGKGGNQAVAAAYAGARTSLVACIGDDDDGHALVADLDAAGVDTSRVTVFPGVRTGAAFVFVAMDGENSIVVAPGANQRVDPRAVASAVMELLDDSGVLVVQAEIPAAAVVAAIDGTERLGGRAVLNLAPYRDLPAQAIALADPLVVNETEAAQLVGAQVHGVSGASEAAEELLQRARSVVVTVGAQGAVVGSPAGVTHVPAPDAEVVDSTGAGDAFTGVVAAALSEGHDLLAAVRQGVIAGSYAVGRPGAQASFPRAQQLADPTPAPHQR